MTIGEIYGKPEKRSKKRFRRWIPHVTWPGVTGLAVFFILGLALIGDQTPYIGIEGNDPIYIHLPEWRGLGWLLILYPFWFALPPVLKDKVKRRTRKLWKVVKQGWLGKEISQQS